MHVPCVRCARHVCFHSMLLVGTRRQQHSH
jgi:hypothetical protein